ncbi:NUDIX hydrolase [Nocardiopsis gilva YIM 90087]|uniref:NUDIX hydrolase n=1 Tax=Nocardiopsis gilva YIM 90087 TaxID=1235441 RepID=A0A223S677_9ACTN|nr:NUDIX hydrolase [Nocardiopsis gilva]ASU83611.1 NUDIX hydrolase [Nocardiopsis gilva YIM 90087]
MSRDRCCGTSVGVLIADDHGRYLMVTRAWHPVGIAPVAGHVLDEHAVRDRTGALVLGASYEQAAIAEVAEEVGLEVVDLDLKLDVHLPNLCSSPPADPPGHHWRIYRAHVTGELAPDPEETRGADWYTPDQVEVLAQRTIMHAHGRLSDEEIIERPGLEAVWVRHLAALGVIRVDPVDLAAVERVYATPPATHWRG